MDAQIEGLIELYLTRGGKVFISPQYDVPFDKDKRDGGACPDVLALDMEKKEVVVVEVSSASEIASLYEKIDKRQTRWFDPIKRRLVYESVISAEWTIRFLGFVRQDNVDRANKRFASHADVWFFAIEEAAFAYAYWVHREEKGLPHRPNALA